jgi:hypothetical protein
MKKGIGTPDWIEIRPLCVAAGYPDRPYLTCDLERGHTGNHRTVIEWENEDD